MGLRNVGWRPGVAERGGLEVAQMAEDSKVGAERRLGRTDGSRWAGKGECRGAQVGAGRPWGRGLAGGVCRAVGRGAWVIEGRAQPQSRAGPGRAREGRPGARRHFRECRGCGRRLVVLSAAGRAADTGERAARPRPPAPVRAARPLPAPWGRPRGCCAQ